MGKRGPKPLPDGERRRERTIRASDPDWTEIREAAAKAGETTSDFVVAAALERARTG